MNHLFGWYYPAGAENDSNAPYNEVEVPEKKFEVLASQTLSKSTSIITNQYIPGASGVDYDSDDEGGCVAVGYQEPDDTSNVNWRQEYHENHHYTPLELIAKFKEYLEKELDTLKDAEETNDNETKQKKRDIKHLIEECEGWTEDEIEIVED